MLALVVVVPVDVVLEVGVEGCVGCDWEDVDVNGNGDDETTVVGVVGNGMGGGGGGGTTCTVGGATTTAGRVAVAVVVVVLAVVSTVLLVASDVTDARTLEDVEDRQDFFAIASSGSACCIMSRFLQLSAMLSRFFQMVATVLLARPSSRATSLLLLPRSISWMIFIFCLIVNASRFRPCVCRFRDAQ